ncbi:MAG TPA: choice-of-anchor J domain-containing protein [Flavobacteriales bacterium]|nr:choice-of-anchor J domain-containing protein [Flavobacteriales bacterium]HMR27091.1 choice-of-anchor J domain-containing protein [Flavobacteriales bacterium]
MRIAIALVASLLGAAAAGQTVLYTENFESAPTFTLNTTDVGSISGGANTWLINSTYAGGNGDVDCSGFTVTFTIPSTAGQPGGIQPANGNYLHTASTEAVADGITCCSFAAADGFCTDPGNHFARMSTDISTLGQTDVTLSFWWLCNGGNQNYGEVYYSTNGGSSWNLITTPIGQYRNQPTWTQQSIMLPAFDNQATLRFGYRFVNGTSLFGGQDPGFGIDDIQVSAAGAQPNAVTTTTVSPVQVCVGGTVQVVYTATGTWGGGNVFTAELSDASGSFVAPVAVGSIASTTPVPITATIPLGTLPGTGYRIRVTASTPATTGTPNAQDISISVGNNAGAGGNIFICKNTGSYVLLNELTGTPDNCGTWTGPNGNPFSGVFDSASDPGGCYTYTVACSVGCPADDTDLCIALIDGANAGQDASAAVCNADGAQSLFPFVVGGDLTGLFFDGTTPLVETPQAAGTYDLTYVVYGQGPCPNDTAALVLVVSDSAWAGSGGTVTFCADDPATPLFGLLTDGPDQGGSWTDPNNLSFGGVFVPGVSPVGLYTYTVNAVAPCPADEAVLAVVVDPCLGVTEADGGQAGLRSWMEGNVLTLSWSFAGEPMIRILDAGGRDVPVEVEAVHPGQARVGVGSLSEGVYTVVLTDRGVRGAARFVITR